MKRKTLRKIITTSLLLACIAVISCITSCKKDDPTPSTVENVLKGIIISDATTLKANTESDTISITMSTNDKLIYSFEIASINQKTVFTYNDNDQLILAENNYGEYMHFNFTEDTTWFETLSYFWNGTDSIEDYYYYYVTGNILARYLESNYPKDLFLQYITYDDSIQFYVKDFENGGLKLKASKYFTFSTTKNPLKNKIDRSTWLCLDAIIDFVPIRNTDYIISDQLIYIWETGEELYYTYEEIFNDTGLLLQITYDNKVYEFLYE